MQFSIRLFPFFAALVTVKSTYKEQSQLEVVLFLFFPSLELCLQEFPRYFLVSFSKQPQQYNTGYPGKPSRCSADVTGVPGRVS